MSSPVRRVLAYAKLIGLCVGGATVASYVLKAVYNYTQKIVGHIRKASTWIFDQQVDAPDALTRREAAYRSSVVSNVEYDLTFWVKTGSTYSGEVEIRFDQTTQEHGIFLDFSGGYIFTLWVNGKYIESDGLPANAGSIRNYEGARCLWKGHRIAITGNLLCSTNRVIIAFQNDYSKNGVGFCQFWDFSDDESYFYTNCDNFQAHRVFPCFDQPGLKARLRLSVVAPAAYSVVTNTPLAEQSNDSPKVELLKIKSLLKDLDSVPPPSILDTVPRGDSILWNFEQSLPMSVNTFFLSVGPFKLFSSLYMATAIDESSATTPILIHYRAANVDTYAYKHFAFTARLARMAIHSFEKYFDFTFPFGKMDIVYLPLDGQNFRMNACGGTLVLTESFLNDFKRNEDKEVTLCFVSALYAIVAKCWIGNIYSMQWWSDYWLYDAICAYLTSVMLDSKYIFTSNQDNNYIELISSSEDENNDLIGSLWFHGYFKEGAYTLDQKATSHPVSCSFRSTDDLPMFASLAKGKGAAILKQLACIVGGDAFNESLRTIINESAWKTSNLRAFFSSIFSIYKQTSNAEFVLDNEWIKSWLGGEGINSIKPFWVCEDNPMRQNPKAKRDSKIIKLFQIHQSATVLFPIVRPHRLRIDVFYQNAEDWLRSLYSGVSIDEFAIYATDIEVHHYWVDVKDDFTPVAELTGCAAPDGVLCNGGDYGYCKIQLDDQTLAFVASNLQYIRCALTRQLIWQALWDMTKDRQLSIIKFIQLVIEKSTYERNFWILSILFRHANMGLQYYVPDALFSNTESILCDHAKVEMAKADSLKEKIFWQKVLVRSATSIHYIKELLDLIDRTPLDPVTEITLQTQAGFNLNEESYENLFHTPVDPNLFKSSKFIDYSKLKRSATEHTLFHPRRLVKPSINLGALNDSADAPTTPSSNQKHGTVKVADAESEVASAEKGPFLLNEAYRWSVLTKFWSINDESLFAEKVNRLRREVQRASFTLPVNMIRRYVSKCYCALPRKSVKMAHWKAFNDINSTSLMDLKAAMRSFYSRDRSLKDTLFAEFENSFFDSVINLNRYKPVELVLEFWDNLFPFHRPTQSIVNKTLNLIDLLPTEKTSEKALKRAAMMAYDELLRAKGCREMALVEAGSALGVELKPMADDHVDSRESETEQQMMLLKELKEYTAYTRTFV